MVRGGWKEERREKSGRKGGLRREERGKSKKDSEAKGRRSRGVERGGRERKRGERERGQRRLEEARRGERERARDRKEGRGFEECSLKVQRFTERSHSKCGKLCGVARPQKEFCKTGEQQPLGRPTYLDP